MSLSRPCHLGLVILAVLYGAMQSRAQASTSDGNGTEALNSAATLAQKGRFAEAEPLARKAVALAPNSAVAHNLLGIIEQQLRSPARSCSEP